MAHYSLNFQISLLKCNSVIEESVYIIHDQVWQDIGTSNDSMEFAAWFYLHTKIQ